MKSIYKTIVKPNGGRYLNGGACSDDKPLILNTSINQRDYQYVNRTGVVLHKPIHNPQVEVGDTVLVHHNVFRQYWGMSTHLRTSSSDIDDGEFAVSPGSIYAYKRDDSDWNMINSMILVEPIKLPETDLILDLDTYYLRRGIVAYSGSESLLEGTIVSFSPDSEHKYVIDGKIMYRMREIDITSIIV